MVLFLILFMILFMILGTTCIKIDETLVLVALLVWASFVINA